MTPSRTDHHPGAGGRLVLGFDPGPTSTGWALLRNGSSPREKPAFVRGGNVASVQIEFVALINEAAVDDIDLLVAVESPSGYVYQQARGAQLLATKGVASEIAASARLLGYDLWERPCAHVRKILCRRASAGDKAVSTALPVFVAGLPKRSNSHVRDAIAVAAVALMSKPNRRPY